MSRWEGKRGTTGSLMAPTSVDCASIEVGALSYLSIIAITLRKKQQNKEHPL